MRDCLGKRNMIHRVANFKCRIRLYAPITCGFALVALAVFLVDLFDTSKRPVLASTFLLLPRQHMRPFIDFYRYFTYVLVHTNWGHFTNNFATVLLVGPILEERLGRRDYCILLGSSAVIPGLIYSILVSHYALVGASGIVFAMIIVSAGLKTTRRRDGTLEIPVTFILLATFWLLHETMSTLTENDNVSRLGHILGGVVGGVWVLLMYNEKSYKSN